MGERIEYLRIVLWYNGYSKPVITVKDIYNSDIDSYVQDNGDAWFFLLTVRTACKQGNYSEDELLDDIFPYIRRTSF